MLFIVLFFALKGAMQTGSDEKGGSETIYFWHFHGSTLNHCNKQGGQELLVHDYSDRKRSLNNNRRFGRIVNV
jgi:hypothetical protein